MDDNDLSDLYQEIILSHNRRPRNEGPLDPCDHDAEGFNPLCGDRIQVFVRENGEGIGEVTFTDEAKSCAISRAAASIMTELVRNRPRSEVDARIAEVLEMLTAKEEPEVDLVTMGDLAALAGVRKFPARVKCATLAWHTLEAALRDREGVSTE